MEHHRMKLVVAILLISSVLLSGTLLAGCKPADEVATESEPTAGIIEEESAPEEPVVEEASDVPPAPLVIAQPLEILSLDPTAGRDPNHFVIIRAIYDGLFEMNQNYEPQPSLAVSYEIIDDLTWQFELRQGVTFHNGEPFNAEAVKFSIEYALREGGINKTKADPIIGAEVVDEYTVKIMTSAPDPVLLKRLAFPSNWMVPPQYITENGSEYFETHPVGTGPFTFQEWTTDGFITLKANPDYWRELPNYDTLIFRPILVNSSRVAALEAGEIDIAIKIPPDLAGTLEGNPEIYLAEVAGSRTYYYGMVNKREDAPTVDQAVRLALNYAIDIDTIIDQIYGGYAQRVGVAPFGPDSFGFDPSVPPFEYNPDKAKELLAEAGYTDGLSLDIGYPAENYLYDKDLAQTMQAYFAAIGVTAEIKSIERGAYWEMYRNDTLPAVYMESMGSYFADADLPLKTIMWSESWLSEYKNELVDELIVNAGSTLDQDLRLEYYSQMQEEFRENPPMIILFQLVNIDGVRSRVSGYVPRSDDLIDFRDISLK